MHAFTPQTRAMAGERRKAIGVHDAMERQIALVAVTECVADRAGSERAAGDHADESVGGDTT